MLLTKYRGEQYKSIINTDEILIHPKITRFVGQNEAGKTALLELLNTLRPIAGGDGKFSLEDYPRNTFNTYKKVHATKPESPVHAQFEVTADELKLIEAKYGKGVLRSTTVTLSKQYDSTTLYRTMDVNEQAYVRNFLKPLQLDADVKAALADVKTIKELKGKIEKFSDEQQAQLTGLTEDLPRDIFKDLTVPYFFYFDEYAVLPGEISLKKMKEFIEADNYTGDDIESLRTAKALIDFAGAEVDEFLVRDNYERLKADLEAAQNAITDQLRHYWSTNKNLEIRLELEHVIQGDRLVDTKLHVRVYNTKHRVTVAFKKRSKGFVWFFSFLAAFSAYKDNDKKIILLLDEPGINLGAVAQRDLLRYFSEQLVPHHQVIFSTHSSAMIDPRQLDTVRTVEDGENGTMVSNDPYRHSSETIFPLQAALGYDLSQSLFVAPNNLLVEGPGDLIYLNLGTQLLKAEKREGLAPAWTPVPTGGADKIATFVSLLGGQGLHLAVFMDIAKGDEQRFRTILENKLMAKRNLISVGSVLDRAEADIEDLFSVEAYLTLVSLSYSTELGGKAISSKDLEQGSPRIVKRLEIYFAENEINGGSFSHYKPAFDLLMNPSWISKVFDAETKSNFEKAFALLNPLLDTEGHNLPAKGLPAKVFKSRTPEAII